MNAKRLMLALVVSLLISAMFTFWLSRHVVKAQHTVAPVKHLVVAPVKTLAAGEVLKAEDLRLVQWPTVLAGSFSKVDEVAGRIVLFPLSPEQPILGLHLAPPGASAGLAAKIPAGMRATSVRSDEVVGVSGFLLPGTHVDVLLTYHTEKSPDPHTTTVLQDVVVLAAGQQIRPDPEGRPATVNNVVTLLLKPEDSAKLVLATSLGAIHFVLRNSADELEEPSTTVGMAQLAGVITDSGDEGKPARPRAKPYEVETVLGDKRMVRAVN
jgi:pilus assembly protein CpaB